MVHGVSVADAAQRSDSREEPDRQAAVDHPIVQEDVGEAEQRHAGSRAYRDGGGESVQVAPDHHESRSDRRVGGGQDVVSLEATAPAGVMRTMDAPQRVMPDVPVEEACPRLHRGGDHQRDGRAYREVRSERHEDTS